MDGASQTSVEKKCLDENVCTTYHVLNRANHRVPMFLSDVNYEAFKGIISGFYGSRSCSLTKVNATLYEIIGQVPPTAGRSGPAESILSFEYLSEFPYIIKEQCAVDARPIRHGPTGGLTSHTFDVR
jgi:hypothetical protein